MRCWIKQIKTTDTIQIPEEKHGADLGRISHLGKIVGSPHKKHIYILSKNQQKLHNIPTGALYNSKKKSAQNSMYSVRNKNAKSYCE